MQRKYEHAFAKIRMAEALHPFDPAVHYAKGYYLAQMNKRAKADSAFARSLALSPMTHQAYTFYALNAIKDTKQA